MRADSTAAVSFYFTKLFTHTCIYSCKISQVYEITSNPAVDWPISLPHDEIYSEACCANSWWSLWPVPITVLNYEGQRGSGTITNHTGKQIALVLFSLAVIKHPGEKKQLKEERVYFSSQFKHQSIMVGMAWHREHEEAGRIVSVVQKKEVITTSASFLCLMQSRSPGHGMVLIFRVGLLTSVNLI